MENILKSNIVEFHKKEVNTKFEEFAIKVMSEQTADSFCFLHATDVHYIRSYPPLIPVYRKLKAMVDFTGYAGIDLLAVTGDLVDGNLPVRLQYRDLYDFVSLVKNSKSTSVVLSKGNHDDCSWYTYAHNLDSSNNIDARQWYNHVVNPIRTQYPIVVDEKNPDGGYYYIDYPQQKIRVINLNTSDFPYENEELYDENKKFKHDHYCAQWILGMREQQIKWLKNALTFEEEGWSVMLMSHEVLFRYREGIDYVRNGELVWEMLKAFKNKAKGKISSNEPNFEFELEYDFTQNKSDDVLPYIFGHCHLDQVIEKDGIFAVSAKNLIKAAMNENVEDDCGDLDGGWDCVILDKKTRTFKSFRFGASDADREFKY